VTSSRTTSRGAGDLLRHWRQHVFDSSIENAPAVERMQSSGLVTVGLRATAHVGGLDVFPSAGYTLLGRLATLNDAGQAVRARLSGFNVGLVVQATP